MFALPKSPFEREMMNLGDGFLQEPEPPPWPRREAYHPRLTPEEREEIGHTGRSEDAAEVAKRHGISVAYVFELRYRYRYGNSNGDGRGNSRGRAKGGRQR